ncbi:MAG: PhoH family protein [Thermoprotei archaeon]|nr:MAG: PhoH family protein [Thermoprotei archaeon]
MLSRTVKTPLDVIKPLTPGQEEFLKALHSKDYDIVGVFGPTGTGKSLLSIAYGITEVLKEKYQRFIIARPLIDIVLEKEITAVELGNLYYDIISTYIRDILASFIDWSIVENLIKKEKVILADIHFLRGRTFDNSVLFLDDAQNIPPESSLELLMRMGNNSKMIIAGDPVFQKNPEITLDGATLLREALMGEERAIVIDLGLKDIVRVGAKRGIKLILEVRMRKRKLNDTEKEILDAAKIYAPDADIITVAEFINDKKRYEITSEHTPDALIITKEGHLGRLIGRGGERINKIQEEIGLKLRAIELTLDFKEFIRAIHPVSWIHKHVIDADFAGPYMLFKVNRDNFGPFVGQKGFHVKFLDAVLRKLMGVGARALEVEAPRRRRRR